ncbi:hypothetical protein pb186bvf_008438 [Paramecium bursaria]
MQQETKIQLKHIFDSFDIDKSGLIDIKEIKQIAQQQGKNLTQNQINQLMETVDQNNDNKISFEEFWYWWQYLQDKNLELLVTTQLKLLDLIKRTYAEFTRFGIPIDQKQDPVYDNHYFAFNYGDFPGHFRIDFKLLMRGSGIEQEIQEQNKGEINIQKSENLDIYIHIQCQNPLQVKELVENAIKTHLETYKPGPEKNFIINFFNGQIFDIKIIAGESHIIFHLTLNQIRLVNQWQKTLRSWIDRLGENFELNINGSIRHKSSLTKMMKKDQQFTKFIVEGFMSEFKIKLNSGLVNTFVKLFLKQIILKGRALNGQKQDIMHSIIFALMLKNSKTHIQLRNPEDIEKFILSLGLEYLMEDQPSASNLLGEVLDEDEIKQFKDDNGPYNLIYKIIQIFGQYNSAIGSIFILFPQSMLKLNFNMIGIKLVLEALLHQNDAL